MFKTNNFFKSIFRTTNQKEVDKLRHIVAKINSNEKNVSKMDESQFKSKTNEFKSKISKGQSLDEILPEAFALVREAAKRTLGERHFDVQLLGGIVLHLGKIAEMKTGEGKTLVATLPVYLNSLTGKGTHVVTVNDYLSKRDSEWMGKIYNYLNISVGCIASGQNDEERKKNYNCDVTYGTNNEFGFDYLRDNMKYSLEDMVQKDHNYCIVDEVDSILIDESRTPLIISGAVEDKSDKYFISDKIIKSLRKEHYETDEKNKNALLTDIGIEKIEELSTKSGILKNNNFYDPQNIELVHHINQALKANFLFSKDTDYIVRDNKVEIIDEFTGRVMEGRRYSDGLHQALEAKEKVDIQSENQTLASITYQNYFRLYKKLSGMTGTALTEAEEFNDIYNLKTLSIPTNEPMIRKDDNDKIFRTENEKNFAIIEKIKECNKTNQPVLVGTTSIEKSEKISKLLKAQNIKHSVLNAKNHEKEAGIIADAGCLGAVTIATNMAGRGTDIQLGGNINNIFKEVKNTSGQNIEEEKKNHQIEKNKVINNGGLFVIGTERHESRRIDNQLRGRSGRQGDPGGSIFFVSLEDDLMRIFGSESIEGIMKKFGFKENDSIDHPWINKALERAQQKVESRNFDIRKTLLKFDDVMNDQRHVIFEQRKEIIKTNNIENIIDGFLNDLCSEITNEKTDLEKGKIDSTFKAKINTLLGHALKDEEVEKISTISNIELTNLLKKKFNEKRSTRLEILSPDGNKELEKRIFLQNLDFLWRTHLQYLEQLRQVIGLRSYGQKDPLDEYKKESFVLFENLLNKIKTDVITFLNNLAVVQETEDEGKKKEPIKSQSIEDKSPDCLLILKQDQKISRNERCKATGKKFKHCCGAL